MILASVMQASCAKTAELINVLFGVEIPGEKRNIAVDGGPHPLTVKREADQCNFRQITWWSFIFFI